MLSFVVGVSVGAFCGVIGACNLLNGGRGGASPSVSETPSGPKPRKK